MAHLIFGKDEVLGRWCASQIPHVGSVDRFGPFTAIGVAENDSPGARLFGVMVFHNYHPEYQWCEISGAANSPKWASKQTLRQLLGYPFYQLGCYLVQTVTPHTDERTIGLNRAMGFKQDGILCHRFGRGVHAVVCTLRVGRYERIYQSERKDGKQERAIPATSARSG